MISDACGFLRRLGGPDRGEQLFGISEQLLTRIQKLLDTRKPSPKKLAQTARDCRVAADGLVEVIVEISRDLDREDPDNATIVAYLDAAAALEKTMRRFDAALQERLANAGRCGGKNKVERP